MSSVLGQLFGTPAKQVLMSRYVLAERLGAGGTGSVYAAYDPELDRRVAVKFLHPTPDTDRAQEQRARLIREGRILARLSHPNVVAVYDVGAHEPVRPPDDDARDGPGIFVVMELVEGHTLDEWLRFTQPSRAEILSVLMAAGRGLHAAHERGLVHRDFKPANLLVGSDGRPRVVDFGLARDVEAFEPPELAVPSDGPASLPSDAEGADPLRRQGLTRVGAVMGTPAYMAPEQHLARAADARSDQFSFCVTLWEALCGARPFTADNLETLKTAVVEGHLTTAAPALPHHLDTALRRGLSPNPTDRFATMAALLRALETAARAKRRRALTIGFTGIVAPLVAALIYVSTTREDRTCEDGRAALGSSWNEEQQQRVRAAFEATDQPFADDAWRFVRAHMERYTTDWSKMHEAACDDSSSRSSPERLERLLCLEWRLTEMRALISRFAAADAPTVRGAVQSLRGLPPVGRCLAKNPARGPLSTEAKQIGSLLSEASSAKISGRYGDAVDAAQRAMRLAVRADDEGLEAETRVALGRLQYEAGALDAANDNLQKALDLGGGGTQEWAVAGAAVSLVLLAASADSDPEEIDEWARRARASIAAVGGDDALTIELHNGLGSIASQRGEVSKALAHFGRADELAAARGEAGRGQRMAIANNLGLLYQQIGRLSDASHALERSLEMAELDYGPRHPEVGVTLMNHGLLMRSAGRYNDARDTFTRALEILHDAHGPHHPLVIRCRGNLAQHLRDQGEYSAGFELARRALDDMGDASFAMRGDRAWLRGIAADAATALGDYDGAKTLLAENGLSGMALVDIKIIAAELACARGEHDHALEIMDTAMTIVETSHGAEHPALAAPLSQRARVLARLERPRESLAAYRRVLSLAEPAVGSDHPLLAVPLTGMARALLALDRAHESALAVERAEALWTDVAVDPAFKAETDFTYARALWRSGGDKVKAMALAERAARALAARTAGPSNSTRSAVRAWIAERR